MSLTFEGQQVVVTGASRGIGRGIAEAFVAAGATVRIIADDPNVAETGTPIGAEARLADITDAAAVTAALADLSHIDVLVNNAGLERLTPVDGPSPETETMFRRIVDINVSGTFIVTRAALPKMQAGGRIINTASVWSRIGRTPVRRLCLLQARRPRSHQDARQGTWPTRHYRQRRLPRLGQNRSLAALPQGNE